ncbi:hypothetical protein F4818DRAFT_437145 [Hypoxylon cercidicola]|nr:hypothetical protein F4818DRAFT_437145 [Hypoxylon cercidicola]
MSDQDTKPVEGVKTPVENPDVATESAIDEASNVAVKDEDETKDVAKDPQETSVVKEATNATEVDQGKVETATPTDSRPGIKPMLRVKRGDPQQKSNPSLLSESDDHTLIRRQVHFYFSDSNLPDDTFLWGKTDGTDNKPVPLSLICSFSRMRRFKPYSAVVDALKTSDQVVLEGPEGEETVRRKEPYQKSDEKNRAILERTVYIKGFGPEHKSLQFDIEDFIAQFGEFNAVRLRRDELDEKKNFKGSVFVEWIDKETADKFMALEPKPAWKVGEDLHKLEIRWKVDYDKSKAEEDANRGNKRHHNNSRPQRGQRGRSQRGGRPGQGGHDSNDWKKRRGDDQRNGFDNRGGRHRGRGQGRGRGRGRGQDNHDRTNETRAGPRDDGRPKIHVSKESAQFMKDEAEKKSQANANGKRARDADDATDARPSKKVDTKEAAVDKA